MHVQHVFLFYQLPDEVLALLCGEVGSDDGDLGAVAISFPIDANSVKACVAQGRREAGVSATYLDSSDSSSSFGDGDLDSDEVVPFGCRGWRWFLVAGRRSHEVGDFLGTGP